jgi:hypothetical protein
MMESAGYGSPWGNEAGKKGGQKLHGKYYDYLVPDLHYASGMECIDCHTAQDSHGDGNIYSKREEGVEIECMDCHGTEDQRSTLTSSEGNPLTNLRKVNSQIVLTTKMDGRDLVVPQAKDLVEKGPDLAMTAMDIATHSSDQSRWSQTV